MIFRKTLGNDDDQENENDEFEAERQGMGGSRRFGLFHNTGVPYYKAEGFCFRTNIGYVKDSHHVY